MTKEISYQELDGLDGVRLEDSYVISITEKSDSIIFYLDAVLTKKHPQYHPKRPSEYDCFEYGNLIFPDLKNIQWLSKAMDKPAEDADGLIDYGNIDSFIFKEGAYYLEGSWGEVIIESGHPRFELAIF